jgi:hypothetical protein
LRSELHVCYCSTDIINIIIGGKMINMWHAYSKEEGNAKFA